MRPKKQVYLIHGWGGGPDRGFFPWLKQELEARGFGVTALAMPDGDNPRIDLWVPFLHAMIPHPNEHTILVGHSMGGQAILRFLEGLPAGMQVGKAILVAGVIDKITNMNDEEKIVAKPWLETLIDAAKVKQSAKGIIAFFSDNDMWIPLESEQVAKELYGATTILEKGMKHYDDDNSKQVPAVLKAIVDNDST